MAGFLAMSLLAGNGIDLLGIVAVTRSENLITQRTSYGLGCTHFSHGSRADVMYITTLRSLALSRMGYNKTQSPTSRLKGVGRRLIGCALVARGKQCFRVHV